MDGPISSTTYWAWAWRHRWPMIAKGVGSQVLVLATIGVVWWLFPQAGESERRVLYVIVNLVVAVALVWPAALVWACAFTAPRRHVEELQQQIAELESELRAKQRALDAPRDRDVVRDEIREVAEMAIVRLGALKGTQDWAAVQQWARQFRAFLCAAVRGATVEDFDLRTHSDASRRDARSFGAARSSLSNWVTSRFLANLEQTPLNREFRADDERWARWRRESRASGEGG